MRAPARALAPARLIACILLAIAGTSLFGEGHAEPAHAAPVAAPIDWCETNTPAELLAAKSEDIVQLPVAQRIAAPGQVAVAAGVAIPGVTESVSIAAVRSLLDVHRQLEKAAGIHKQLLITARPDPNAQANFASNTICVTTGLLGIIGTNKEMAAALLGHEFAHQLRRHDIRFGQAKNIIVASAVSRAKKVYAKTGSVSTAVEQGQTALKEIVFGFWREQEAEADRVGTRLAADAGFDPNGILLLTNEIVRRWGDKPTGLFDTHPSFAERRARLKPIVADEQFNQQARDVCDGSDWAGCKTLVDEWIDVLPDSGRGWYQKGLLQKQARNSHSVEAFENAVNCDYELSKAWFELCVGLYQQGYKLESAHCSQWIPDEMRDAYIAKTFKGVVVAGGKSLPPSNLSIGREANGRKMITNDSGVLQAHGIAAAPLPPAWRPLRYRPIACERR